MGNGYFPCETGEDTGQDVTQPSIEGQVSFLQQSHNGGGDRKISWYINGTIVSIMSTKFMAIGIKEKNKRDNTEYI